MSEYCRYYLHVFDIVHGWFNERIERKVMVKIFGQASKKETGQKII